MGKNSTRLTYERFHKRSKPLVFLPNPSSFTYRHVIEFIENNVDFKKVRNILDLGCGVGPLSFYLANRFPHTHVTGIDISSKAIKACISFKNDRLIKNSSFFQSETNNKKLEDRKYDLIIASEVIEHIDNDQDFIKRCHGLLNKNKYFLVTTPSINAPLYKLGMLKKFDFSVGHIRRYSMSQLEKIIKSHGFKVLNKRKNEGILRNLLFTNKAGGFILRFVNKFSFLNNFVTNLDNRLIHVFGESNLFIISKKQ